MVLSPVSYNLFVRKQCGLHRRPTLLISITEPESWTVKEKPTVWNASWQKRGMRGKSVARNPKRKDIGIESNLKVMGREKTIR